MLTLLTVNGNVLTVGNNELSTVNIEQGYTFEVMGKVAIGYEEYLYLAYAVAPAAEDFDLSFYIYNSPYDNYEKILPLDAHNEREALTIYANSIKNSI